MGKVKRSDKDFEDYDYDEDDDKEKIEESESLHEDEKGEIHPLGPKNGIITKDDKIFKGIPDECEEPGCERPATKVWKGKKVCADHYDYYRDKEQSLYTFYY